MIFQHTLPQLLRDDKTQTRRLVRDGEIALYNPSGAITAVRTASGRLKWAVGRTYAVQPGRGQAAVARIRLTGIRLERVQDITEADAADEGCPRCTACGGGGGYGYAYDENGAHVVTCLVCQGSGVETAPRVWYAETWDTIHTRPGTRCADNPQVWVLDFELVKEEQQ